MHNTDGTRSVPTTMNVRGAMNCATTNAEFCLNQDGPNQEINGMNACGRSPGMNARMAFTAECAYYYECPRRNELRDYKQTIC